MVHSIDTRNSFLDGADMTAKADELLNKIIELTGFEQKEKLWVSTYYGTDQIGAILYTGTYDGMDVVLKVQGVKPELSEIWAIERFSEQNKSEKVRPPKLYKTILWGTEGEFEALIMERVNGSKVLPQSRLVTGNEVKIFFEIFDEYRKSCINTPWIDKPAVMEAVIDGQEIEKLRAFAKKIKPESELRLPGDWELAEEAMRVLNNVRRGQKLEFMHGHLSCEDLIRQGDEIVVFSNLFWKWKPACYDTVFAYHWFMLNLQKIVGISPEEVERQREIWIKGMEETKDVMGRENGLKKLKAAMLERAIATLLVDGPAFLDEKIPITRYLMESSREQIKKLMNEIDGH